MQSTVVAPSVLALVLSSPYSTRDMAIALMQTSRALRHRSAIELLHYPPVDIHNDVKLDSFLAFLDNHHPMLRLPHVHTLRLSVMRPSRATAERLLACVAGMTSLRSLVLENTETLFEVLPELSSAFARLDKIVDLELGEIGPLTVTMIQETRSQLRRVRLRRAHLLMLAPLCSDPDPATLAPLCLDSVTLFARHAASLEELSCVDWVPHTQPKEVPATFSKLRKFAVDSVCAPSLAWYHAAFPNLKTLEVQLSYCDPLSPEEHVRPYREGNLNLIEKAKVIHGSETWPQLEEVRVGVLLDAYALGLTCPVKTLELGMAMYVQWLPEILEATRPEHLSIMPQPSLDGLTISSAFVDVFRDTAKVASIRKLELTWIFYVNITTDLCYAFMGLFDVLRGLSIDTLYIHVSIRYRHRMSERVRAVHGQVQERARNSANQLAQYGLEVVPSLNQVVVDVRDRLPFVAPAWTLISKRRVIDYY